MQKKRKRDKKLAEYGQRVLAKAKELPVLPLSEAIKRLGDPKVYRRATVRFERDDV